MFPKLLEIKPLENYTLWLKYDDDTEGTVDLSSIAGKGVFQIWDKQITFDKVYIDRQRAIAWSDEIDICADSMYLRIKKISFEDFKNSSYRLIRND
jgi:hypothetical protein